LTVATPSQSTEGETEADEDRNLDSLSPPTPLSPNDYSVGEEVDSTNRKARTNRLWAQKGTTGNETMSEKEDNKIQRFSGRAQDDYNLWRVRAEICLKGKGYWKQLQNEDCAEEIKEKSAAILVNALGDSAFRVCSSQVSEPLKMLELLDLRYASTRAATRISILTSVYSKTFGVKDNMPKYIDDFESLFSQLERMGKQTAIPETHKAPLLLASLSQYSPLQSSVTALRLKDTDDLT